MQALKKRLAKMLRDIANKIDAGTCEMSESEAIALMQNLAHIGMSKEEASMYLGLSRSRFDDYVRKGWLPRGKKRIGFKELVWYKDDLDEFIKAGR